MEKFHVNEGHPIVFSLYGLPRIELLNSIDGRDPRAEVDVEAYGKTDETYEKHHI